MSNTKILAFYLPQFHETEYNNEWWGKGYTDWVAAKNARPLFKGHNQPRRPLNDNYYDLADESGATWKWQADLAREHGIYGFCIYHYWFKGTGYLDTPVKILLNHPEIDINYSLCWDSGSWKRTWYANSSEFETLVQQDYGDESMWEKHFKDLLPYFKDSRYIKIDNKPVFHIYKAHLIPCLKAMRDCWNRMARNEGFAGVYLIVGDVSNRESLLDKADAFYNYQPVYSHEHGSKDAEVVSRMLLAELKKTINRLLGTKMFPDKRPAKMMYRLIKKQDKYDVGKTNYGIIADYDDTPRKQLKGVVVTENDVKYFKDALRCLLEKSCQKGNNFVYITAWNEWGESSYLEPDAVNGTKYLEAVKEAVGEE